VSRKILIVDDDPMVLHLERTMLEASGFEVHSADCGEGAISWLEKAKRPLDLTCVILDVQMPDMNGFDVLTRIKLQSDTQNIPVIMLTCQDSPEDIFEGYNIGAEYYITKPFTREQLLYGIDLVSGGTSAGGKETTR